MVRKLTLKECYRLMGFPEDFKSYPSAGESYKQIGNSVCVPVVEAIAKEILGGFNRPALSGVLTRI